MATRIKSSAMSVFANDTQLDRITTFGVSSRLDSEDLREIGNEDIVEVVDAVPTVDITCDANQYGSVKTLSKFAGKNHNWGTIVPVLKDANEITVKKGVYFIDEAKWVLAADVDKTIEAPASGKHRFDVVSIGTTGTVTITKGVEANLASAVEIPATPAGELRLGIVEAIYEGAGLQPLTAKHILACNDEHVVTLKDFEYATVDFECPVKETGDNTTTDPITRTMYVENAFINRYDSAFSVTGLATESMSLESDNKKWFLNDGAVVFVDRFPGDGVLTDFTLSYTPTLMKNGKYLLKVYKYDSATAKYTALTEAADGAGTYVFTLGTKKVAPHDVLAATEVLVVRYPTDPDAVAEADMPFFKRVPADIAGHPAVPGGLRHGQVEIYLSDDQSNHVLRLQTVSVSSQLSRDALYEIGHKRAYSRPLTYPVPITIQVETLQSDLKEFARLCGKAAEFAAGTLDEISIEEFIKDMHLLVKIYREDDVTRAISPSVQSIPIKTYEIEDVSVTDENASLSTGGNGTQTFGLKANTNLKVTSIL